MFLASMLKALLYVFHMARLMWLANLEVCDFPDKVHANPSTFHLLLIVCGESSWSAVGADKSWAQLFLAQIIFTIPGNKVWQKMIIRKTLNSPACANICSRVGCSSARGHREMLPAYISLKRTLFPLLGLELHFDWPGELATQKRISLYYFRMCRNKMQLRPSAALCCILE